MEGLATASMDRPTKIPPVSHEMEESPLLAPQGYCKVIGQRVLDRHPRAFLFSVREKCDVNGPLGQLLLVSRVVAAKVKGHFGSRESCF